MECGRGGMGEEREHREGRERVRVEGIELVSRGSEEKGYSGVVWGGNMRVGTKKEQENQRGGDRGGGERGAERTFRTWTLGGKGDGGEKKEFDASVMKLVAVLCVKRGGLRGREIP